MKYEVLFLGKTKESFLTKGIEEYQKRLAHYAAVKVKTIKTGKLQGNNGVIKEREADILLAQVVPSSHLVALDEHGKELTSTEFSKKITHWEGRNIRNVTFVIGGPLGLSQRLLDSSQEILSLSRMTFTHDMVRLFLLEQLYRAYTIKAGEKYHK